MNLHQVIQKLTDKLHYFKLLHVGLIISSFLISFLDELELDIHFIFFLNNLFL